MTHTHSQTFIPVLAPSLLCIQAITSCPALPQPLPPGPTRPLQLYAERGRAHPTSLSLIYTGRAGAPIQFTRGGVRCSPPHTNPPRRRLAGAASLSSPLASVAVPRELPASNPSRTVLLVLLPPPGLGVTPPSAREPGGRFGADTRGVRSSGVRASRGMR
ncbi:hypothetical protein PVAP13_9KG402634 [Panicum virgatum]|uniref:Uncharacterized protein n=1 Tax=Panicum virgatum TaxID=38727 RepID=A0A8T0NDH8_PANVG|nr:hypothetical protein PVAP13_9KG402634 [Panicum virgatum]